MLPACVVLLCAQSTNVRVDGLTINDHEMYSLQVLNDIPDAGAAEGVRHTVGDVSLLTSTETIPARLGVRFGFHYTVSGAPQGGQVTVHYVNRFPEPGLKNPDTGVTTHIEEYDSAVLVGATNYKGWSFDHNYELVPGTWTFEIWYGGRKLGEQSFNVVAAQ